MPAVSTVVSKEYPPCRKACPAGVNVQAYVALVSQGKFEEALKVIRKSIPFPSVCGRVCFAPCEDACSRKNVDEPVAIRALKRLVAEHEATSGRREKPKPIPKIHPERIAIIGSGPAGLTAAYELAKLGYPVVVFESASKPGGSLRYCIPEYRLPESALDAEIEYIRETGVEIRLNTKIGRDLTIDDIIKQGYKAVFIATGAHQCISLNIKGEELSGVFHALDFLVKARAGDQLDIRDKVAVIGGGNVAVDAARTSMRLGAKEVTIIYRRSEKEMPAHRKEIEEAKQEGVKFLFLAAPKRILGQSGRVSGIECIKTVLGQADKSGRRRPVPVEGSEFVVTASAVLLAIGEMPNVSFLPKDVEVARGNRVVVDQVTLETRSSGVFAGGDVVSGPASVIEAIAAGKRAAISIDRYVKGVDLKVGRTEEVYETTWVPEEAILVKKPRQKVSCLEATERARCFDEVELGLTPEAGLLESRRCLSCGPCAECLEKEELCDADDVIVDSDRCIACANCQKICEYGAIEVDKSVAKIDPNLCKGCGTCAVECPAEAIAMQNFSDEKLLAQLEDAAASWGAGKPKTLAFVCNWSTKESALEWPKDTRVIPVRCSGRVDPLHVLRAFALGADGVLIVSCESKACHYTFGSTVARRRVAEIREWLRAIGIEPERLTLEMSSVGNEQHLNEMIRSFADKVEKAGATPLRVATGE